MSSQTRKRLKHEENEDKEVVNEDKQMSEEEEESEDIDEELDSDDTQDKQTINKVLILNIINYNKQCFLLN